MKSLRILAKPGSSKGPRVEDTPEGLAVYVREKAIDGAANKAIVKTLADHLNVPKSKVSIKSGASGRFKTVLVDC